jgi:predicted metal-dependent peptidase
MLNDNKLHPKIIHCIEMMLLNSKVNLPYYGEFNLCVNYAARPNDPNLPTAGVNVTTKGMNHYYNPKFIDSLTQKQVNFLVLHETFHLLFSHPKRTRMGGFDHKLSNIAQDMIINQILVQDIKPDFVDIPKDDWGKNTALMIPKEYEGEWVFEFLYDWLKTAKEESEKRREKKEDEKIFAELFCKKDRPAVYEYNANTYKGQEKVFYDVLEDKSKDEAQEYMSNFVRRVVVSLTNMMPVKLIGHTSSIIPDGKPASHNDDLSLRRAELFKNAVIERIELYMDIYALCITILEDEKQTLTRDQMKDFIIDYEEITNKTMKKKRLKELDEPIDSDKDQAVVLFETYRFSELNKLDEKSLKSIIAAKNLALPNVQQMKTQYVQLAQNMIDVEGKGDNEKIIENDDDDQPAKLRSEISHLPQYKSYANLTDPEKKQYINRRVEYKFDESMDGGMGGGSSPQSQNQQNRDGYGQNGQNGQDSYGLDQIFDEMESNNGQFMDSHLPDDVPEELREQMIKDTRERLKARGFESADVESTLNKLRKRRKDYLKEIKRGISQIKGNQKLRSILRPSRRGLSGLKGNKKIGAKINVILDTSGSMGGYFEKALSFIFRSDIEINLIQVDTKVHGCENIKNKHQLEKVVIKGLGGTIIQPGVDYVKEKYPQFNTLILTDGYTDALNFAGYRGKVLIISNGSECPIEASNGKVKQIIVED